MQTILIYDYDKLPLDYTKDKVALHGKGQVASKPLIFLAPYQYTARGSPVQLTTTTDLAT